jgi:hypothetical protein
VAEVRPLNVPGLDAERHLVLIEKAASAHGQIKWGK